MRCSRRGLQLMLVGLGWLLLWPLAQAGAQPEEPLLDSVRTALSSAIARQAPPQPEFANTQARQQYEGWMARMGARLKRQTPDPMVRQEFLQTIWYESRRAGLEPSLVLGLVQVESNFRKHAISNAGARGYMQVMPFWTRVLADGDAAKLFHLQTNLRFGCVILRHYLDREQGNLFMALGRYNGSRGQAPYPQAVLAAKKSWDF